MITRDLVAFRTPSMRGRPCGLPPVVERREDLESYLRVTQFAVGREWRVLREEEWLLEPVPSCQCCGAFATTEWDNGQARCRRHLNKNPCAIEGCKRTRSASDSRVLADDAWLCPEHWRRFVPPRSLRRRAYNAFWRKAKRRGWDDDLVRQFHRFWDQLIATARAKHEGGSINVSEINRLFGWD